MKDVRISRTAMALVVSAVCGALMAASPTESMAASSDGVSDYPNKPVRLILGQAPGGGQDIISRALAQKLSETLGQSFIVDNRSGAGGTLGAALAVKATPDGYTALIVSSTYSINPSLYKNLSFDPKKDLVPVTLIAASPFILLVHPSLPAKSVKDLIAYAKERPKELNYASGGIGNSGHLAAELFGNLAGIQMTHVPYKGTGLAMPDLLAGRVHLLFNSMLQGMRYAKKQQLVALGITTTSRSPLMPELPTIAEAGLPGYDFSSWYGVMVPAGTPRGIINKLNAEIVGVLNQPDFRKRLLADGSLPIGSTPDQFAAHVSAEMTRWAAVVKSSGMRIE